MADGWIELFDVKTDEAELLFVFDRFEPVDYSCGVVPLVEDAFFRDCAVDALEDVFADFACVFSGSTIMFILEFSKGVKYLTVAQLSIN